MSIFWARSKLFSSHNNKKASQSPSHLSENYPIQENTEPKESLSYALNKFRNSQRGPASVANAAVENNTDFEIQEFVRQLRGLASHPEAFSESLEARLNKLDAERITERTTLMQEMFLVLHYESRAELLRLLTDEQRWIAAHSKSIHDKAKLNNHIEEVVKITARSYDNSNERYEALKKMAQQIKMDAYALKAFRQALVSNSEWDITDIFDNIPEDLKNYLQGKQK